MLEVVFVACSSICLLCFLVSVKKRFLHCGFYLRVASVLFSINLHAFYSRVASIQENRVSSAASLIHS